MLDRANLDSDHLICHITINYPQVTTRGFCAGLSVASAFHFLYSEKKHRVFSEIILSIAAYTAEKLKNDLIELKKRKRNPQYILTKKDNQLGHIRFLFEIIAIYSEPQAYHKVFGKFISQPKIIEISKAMKNTYKKADSKNFFSHVNVGHFPTMLEQGSQIVFQYQKFLNDIKKTAQTMPPCRVSFLLDSLEHRVALNYDGVYDIWFSADLRHFNQIGEEISYKQLMEHIFKTLRTSSKAKVIELETIVFTAPFNAERFSKCFIGTEKLAFRSLKTDTGEIRETPKKVTLLHLAAKFGEINIINQITDEKLLNLPTSGGLTPLLIAAEQDQTDTVQALLIKKANPNIILNDTTAFSYATRYKNHEMMDMLLKAQTTFDKPKLNKQENTKIGEKRKAPSSLSFLQPLKTKKESHFFFTSPDMAVPEGLDLHFIQGKIYIQKADIMISVLTSLQAQLKKQGGLGKKRKINRSFLMPT